MKKGRSWMLQLLLSFRILNAVDCLPTLGQVDRNRLETYEDLSERRENDIFGNLTFQFSCESRPTGLYADLNFGCRIFHACDDSGNGFPVICPNETLFDQRERICTEEENVDCENANEWYYLNELLYSIELTEENEPTSTEREEVPSVLPLLAP